MNLELPRPLSHPREREQWGNAAVVLSLDGTAPFHDAMEVPVDKAFFVSELRALVEQGRAEYAGDPSCPPPLAERWLAALAATRGDEAALRFTTWMRDTFTDLPFDWPHWGTWETVFVQWAYERGELQVLPSAKRFAALLESYRTCIDARSLDASLDQARAARAQGWDLEMLARHRSYDDDGLDPFLFVGFTVQRARFRRFVRHLNATLDLQEKEQLTAAAQQLAHRLGLWRATPLVRPDALLDEAAGC